jgi:zinc protease
VTGASALVQTLSFPPLPEFEPASPRVTRLPSGLRVYLMEDHELPLLSIRVMVRAGSAYEPAEKLGLASVAATVTRTGGSATNPGDALDEELGALAATIDVSAGTLSATAAAHGLAETLPRLLELFADVVRRPAFPEDKTELARVLLRTAISRRNDQIGQMGQRAFQIAMYGKESPFAREPEYATADAITREDLAGFHARYFRPDRALLGLAGDFDPDRALAEVERRFGDWPAADAPLPQVVTDPLPISSRRLFHVEKGDVNQTHLHVGGRSVRRNDPDWPALRVASYVLGAGGFGSRLLKKIRTELGLAYSIGGGFAAEFDRVGLFRVACQTKTESTAKAIEAVLRELEGFLDSPPTEEEVTFAKEQIRNAEIFEYDSRANLLARRMTLDYHGYPSDFLERLNARIRGLTAGEIAGAIRRHLDPAKLSIVTAGRHEAFDRPLETFGPVTTLDLSIR